MSGEELIGECGGECVVVGEYICEDDDEYSSSSMIGADGGVSTDSEVAVCIGEKYSH